MKKSEILTQKAEEVALFRNALISLFEISQVVPTGVVGHRVAPVAGREIEWAQLEAEVALLAGKAALAAKGSQQHYVVMGRVHSLVEGWRNTINNPEMFPMADLISGLNTLVGTLDGKASAARAKERSFVGRIAAFIGLPAAIKAAVAEDHPRAGNVGFGAGILVQILIVGLGGAVTAGVVAAAIKVWNMAF